MYCRNRRNPLRARSWSFAENKGRGRRDILAPHFKVASVATASQMLYKSVASGRAFFKEHALLYTTLFTRYRNGHKLQ